MIFGVVAVVAVAAYFLLLKPGGGPSGPSQPVAAQSPQTSQTSSPKPAPSVKAHKGKPRRSQPPAPLVGGRDPFSPLVNASAGGGTGPVPSGGGTAPSGSPATVSPPASPASTPSGGTGTRIGGHDVTLLGIFTRDGVQKAQISVDGTTYVVAPGSDFDGHFRLVSITGGCARILYGDQSFLLCENPQK
jgi:hypothetical protein